MFRKALKLGVMGWRPLITALRAAADRWTVEEVKRLLKEFFDPDEFGILWHRISRFTETCMQLETRFQAQEEGLILPKGDHGKYVKWINQTMVRPQYTQELDVNEWRAIRERHENASEIPPNSIPTFARKKVMFGALMEEKREISPEWEEELNNICPCIRKDEDPGLIGDGSLFFRMVV